MIGIQEWWHGDWNELTSKESLRWFSNGKDGFPVFMLLMLLLILF